MPTGLTTLAKEMSGYLSSPDCDGINSSVPKVPLAAQTPPTHPAECQQPLALLPTG